LFTTSGKIAMGASPCPGQPLAAQLWFGIFEDAACLGQRGVG